MFPTDIPMEVDNCGDASISISEDSSTNHHLLNLAAHDPDLNPVLTYQIASVTPDHRSCKHLIYSCACTQHDCGWD